MTLAQQIAERDPFALKFAKASVNEMQNAQGWREAMEGAFKNYMMTIPHRIELGTYGPKAREKNPKDRFAVLTEVELIIAWRGRGVGRLPPSAMLNDKALTKRSRRRPRSRACRRIDARPR